MTKTGQYETILLVEDEPAIRQLMAVTLVRAGYDVVEARNGFEALAIGRQTDVDLLLVDMDLPGVCGREVIRHLRLRRPSLKALSMSGYPLDTPNEAGVPFLRKPFSAAAFLTEVRAVLDGSHEGLNPSSTHL